MCGQCTQSVPRLVMAAQWVTIFRIEWMCGQRPEGFPQLVMTAQGVTINSHKGVTLLVDF